MFADKEESGEEEGLGEEEEEEDDDDDDEYALGDEGVAPSKSGWREESSMSGFMNHSLNSR